MIRKLFPLFVTTIFLWSLCVPLSRISTAEGNLTLSPPLSDVTLGPGLLKTSITITLKNSSESAILASYKLVDLKALGQYGGNTLDRAGLPEAYDLANWMSLPDGNSQRISKDETANIKVTIDNRADLTPGGHYGALVITTSPENSSTSSISLNQQIISLIFVKKIGGEVFGLDLTSIQPNTTGVPTSVELQFKSTGNVHVVPRGYIEVTDPKGKVIAKGIINSDSSLILPGATRKFITLIKPVSDSQLMGRYTTTVFYRYDEQSKFSTKSVYFYKGQQINRLFIIPVPFLLLLVGALFFLRRRKQPIDNSQA